MHQISYGLHAVKAALDASPSTIGQLYVQDSRAKQPKIKALIKQANDSNIAVGVVNAGRLNELTGDANHQGVCVELASTKTYTEFDIKALLQTNESPALILILDTIQDPHNLGACLRSADASGVDFVIMPKDKSAKINDTVHKVSCGASTRVKTVVVTNLARAIEMLKQDGVWIYGLDDQANQTLYDHSFSDSCALVMGSEGKGMRQLTRNSCDFLLSIPMKGSVSSLNVSVAAGVGLYEVLRQRRLSTK